jgi:carbonic anhydrase
MRTLEQLFKNNRQWATEMEKRQPGFFNSLAKQQSPQYLWIGCSDSRVPANEIVSLAPGELFVHRNLANLIEHTDMNCMAVLQYAVEKLRVRHIIVCGHYGCGGVSAMMNGRADGLVEHWLGPLRDVSARHKAILASAEGEKRLRRFCELNVVEQVRSVCSVPFVQHAWQNGMELSVHGWIYDIADGLLRDNRMCVVNPDETDAICDRAAEIISTWKD